MTAGFILALLVGAAGAGAPVQTTAPAPQLANARDAFDIAVPAGCELTTRGVTIDFQVFYVVCGGRTYAGVYAGNAADRSMARSRLMATPYQWPTEIQAWSVVVAGDQAKADAIAASVRVRAAGRPGR